MIGQLRQAPYVSVGACLHQIVDECWLRSRYGQCCIDAARGPFSIASIHEERLRLKLLTYYRPYTLAEEQVGFGWVSAEHSELGVQLSSSSSAAFM